jgi:hypothetical protein
MTTDERSARRREVAASLLHDGLPHQIDNFASFLFVDADGDVYAANDDGSPRLVDDLSGSGVLVRMPLDRWLTICQAADFSLLVSAPWGGSRPPRPQRMPKRWTVEECDLCL